MARTRTSSPQTLNLLSALADEPAAWHHGYELTRLVGLQSGTLYPILMRLEAHGYLQAQWQHTGVAGRPLRHAYRLTASGRKFVAEQLQASPVKARKATA
jgi:PadR family transcriptional regulator, regulatory protein PadR